MPEPGTAAWYRTHCVYCGQTGHSYQTDSRCTYKDAADREDRSEVARKGWTHAPEERAEGELRMMPDRTSVNNAFYWGTIDPLDVRTHSVLRSIARGLYQFGQDEGRFEVALLIARECVDA